MPPDLANPSASSNPRTSAVRRTDFCHGELVQIPIPSRHTRFSESQVVARGCQMRMNFQRSAKADRRFAKLAERHVAETLARRGSKVIGIARESLFAVGDGTNKILSQEAHRRTFVPTFAKIGRDFDDARE